MLSFLIVNAVCWGFLLGSLIGHPDDVFEAINIGPAFFYAPFSLIAIYLPSSFGVGDSDLVITIFGNSPITVITIPLIGILCHLGMGYLIGRYFGKDVPKWYISLPISLLIILVISFTALRIAVISGFLS